MKWPMIIILVGSFLILYWSCFVYEGFSYLNNPCSAFDSCSSCAAAAGCGWCTDLKQCQPMAQDGFPIRTPDLTTGALEVSPYLAEGVLPVVTDCPPNCRTTDFGDCECTMSDSYKNSCAPDCYEVYGDVPEVDAKGGSTVADIKISSENRKCVCPKTESGSGAIVPISKEEGVTARMANARAGINRLLRSTRIHVCSPHTFVTDSARC